MNNFKFTGLLSLAVLIFFSCSLANKFKEKLSSKKDELSKEFSKTSEDEMKYYNAYIEVMNKIQDACDDVNQSYQSDIRSPANIAKNSFIVAVSLSLYTQTLENLVKSYKRSYFDDGELAKLNTSGEMKNEIENNFKNVLTAMEEYSLVANKVTDYYTTNEFKKDLSKVKPYDEEMKASYEKYNNLFKTFAASIKKYKPARDKRDPNTISDPDERSSTIVINAYGDILEAAEGFYEKFEGLKYRSDLSEANAKLTEFEKVYKESKQTLLNAEYTERTKYLKYAFEDYFENTVLVFIDAGKGFFENAPVAKNEDVYNKSYNKVIENYNKMIDSYNTNVSTVNRIRSW